MNNEQEQLAVRQRTATNLAVVANMVELTKQVVQRVVHDDVASSIGGEVNDPAYMGDLITAKIGAQLSLQQKGA